MAWLRRFLFLLLFPAAAFGQGMRYDNFVLKPLPAGGVTSVSGALITVCTSVGTGTPCTPKVANIYSDEALTTPIVGTGGAGTTNSDSGGNFGFYAVPGNYIVTVTGTGITSYTIKVILPLGTAATNTFTNHNQMYWAGPGATPTIDQAVASCAASPAPCIVTISPGYTGPESVNLFTTSTCYQVYTGGTNQNNITIEDLRANSATPTTPCAAPQYGLVYGGRGQGALTRLTANYYANSPPDSTAATNSFNWPTGLMPANGGTQNGAESVVETHDTTNFKQSAFTVANSPTGATDAAGVVTITTTAPCNILSGELVTIAGVAVAGYNGTFPTSTACVGSSFTYTNTNTALAASGSGTVTPISNAIVAAQDGEAYHDATSSDAELGYLSAFIGQSGMRRTNATGSITSAVVHTANPCANVSSSGGKISNCYGMESFQGRVGKGVNRNYAYHSWGDFLFEANTAMDFVDTGFNITAASEAVNTVTITTSGVCNFPTGQVVDISNVSVGSFGYNGRWTVLAPGCNGTNTFTYTNTASGLAAISSAPSGVVLGVHRAITWLPSDSSVTLVPYLDTVGWKFNLNAGGTIAQIKSTGLFAGSTIGATSSGGAFLGGTTSEFAGAYFRETSAPTGNTADTVFGATSADHMASFIQNGVGGVQHWPSTVVLHTAYTNATATFSTLGDGTRAATFAVAANTDYLLTCDITFNPSATTAVPKIQVTGPAAPTAVNITAMGGSSATTFDDATAAAFSTPITTLTAAATTNQVLRITAGIANGANAGTVALQLAANGVGTLTVNAGSACRIQ